MSKPKGQFDSNQIENRRLLLISVIIGNLTGALICFMESRSLNVAVCGSFNVSKSMVMPNGTAIWSVLAYRLPIEPLPASTLCDTSCSVSDLAVIRE